ncbi:MAG: DNA cytosine methyltransferase [Acidobacteria bacterium]|nr:DNA cytosine methyltransferase [Acidobacteriota bacterium]MCI0722228.1 DNA cytosine methyltransferase [Acidobacteriota bacterium]
MKSMFGQETTAPPQVVSVFSGCGGMDLGFESAGFEPILAIDVDQAACHTYRLNHPLVRVLRRDLASATPGYVAERLGELPELVSPVGVIGGPPCQAFSRGNGHKRADDPRAQLPRHYARIVRELNDAFEIDFFVFENVLGLRHRQHDQVFREFKDLFTDAGFRIFEGELDAVNFGVPQIRRRVFVVGFNCRKYSTLQFVFPNRRTNKPRCVADLLEKLPEPTFFRRGLSPEDIAFHPNHWCMNPRSDRFTDGSLRQGRITGRPFRVLRWDAPSWTVAYGHREVHVHPRGTRRLSVLEAMLLQGFPQRYQLCGTLSDQVRQISDAVPPPLARGLARAIRKTLGYDNGQRPS